MAIPSKQQWLTDTLVVIVLYKMALEDSPTFVTLGKALESNDSRLDLFVYDNSPTCKESNKNNLWHIEYRHNPDNAGVSRSYNEAKDWALKIGKRWLLLVDQDTEFPSNALSSYYQSLQEEPDQECFVPRLIDHRGLLSPFRFHLGNGFRIGSISAGIHPLKKLQFINSGMLIHMETFVKAGGFNEKLKLDFSDLSFIERLRRIISHFVVVDFTAHHSLSGAVNSHVLQMLGRFKSYCQAAKEFNNSELKNLSLSFYLFPRALKLCMTYRTWVFMLVAWQTLRTRHA